MMARRILMDRPLSEEVAGGVLEPNGQSTYFPPSPRNDSGPSPPLWPGLD
jgi:hypothetical protein